MSDPIEADLPPEYHAVPEEHVGLELDEYLCLLYPGVPKGKLRQQVREGRVTIDGEQVEPSRRLKRSSVLVMQIPTEVLTKAPPRGPRVDVLYEDEQVIAVEKPAGVAVEPERWMREADCMAGAMLALAQERTAAASGADEPISDTLIFRPRLLHRLDKETSGVLLAAKDLETERRLRVAFSERRVRKDYLALVEGEWDTGIGVVRTIDAPIGPDERRTGRMRVVRDGRESRTEVELEQAFRGYSLLRCRPLSGRTHQIRVHLAHEGFPLLIDKLYGRHDAFMLSQIKRGYRTKRGQQERPLMERLTLHAAALVFPAPGAVDRAAPGAAPDALPPTTFTPHATDGPGRSACGHWRRVTSPLPNDFSRVLKQLAKLRAIRL